MTLVLRVRRKTPSPAEFRRWLSDEPVPTPPESFSLDEKLSVEETIAHLRGAKETLERGEIEYNSYSLTRITSKRGARPSLREFLNFTNVSYVPKVDIPAFPGMSYVIRNCRISSIRFATPNYLGGRTTGINFSIHVDNCLIDHLAFRSQFPGVEVHVSDSWIGMIDLRGQTLTVFEAKRSGILMIKCAPPYGQNPFTGHVNFEEVYVPKRDGEYKEQKYSPQPWASMRAHVLALGNQKDAGLFHAAQLRIEQQYETSLPVKAVSWVYGIASNYGNSIGRPIAGLAGSSLVLFVMYFFADAAVQRPGTSVANWRSIFSDGCSGQFWRALYLSAQPVLNPLGGMVGGASPVEPAGIGWSMIHGGHRLVSLALIFLLLLSIRRRFRM